MKKRLNFILLNGAMGTGKTTIAKLLERKLDQTAILEIEDIRRLVTGKENNSLAWSVIYRMCDEYFNDANKEVEFLIDQKLLDENNIYIHPNINTATLEISIKDFKRFINELGYLIKPIVI